MVYRYLKCICFIELEYGKTSVDGSVAVGAPLGVGGVQRGGEGPGVVSKVVLIIELRSLNLELEPEATRGSKVRVSADWGSGLLGGAGNKLGLLGLRYRYTLDTKLMK